MLIPSIDVQRGRIVQLVQGERLAVESTDVEGWIARFRGHRAIQLIDLDAAKGEGSNDLLVARICAQVPCRVGGGIRSIERAREVLVRGATHVILGSALFVDGAVDVRFVSAIAAAVGPERLIAAVDSRGGRIAIHGWRTVLNMSTLDAVRELQPFVSEFLYTHVDREGLMAGTDMPAVLAVRNATTRRVTAAGGITTNDEVELLDGLGVDAVVGMAIYTGRMHVPDIAD
jgi:phosphoribosylformimino-5-aminoimidazole carboxamide ribotide isomerase